MASVVVITYKTLIQESEVNVRRGLVLKQIKPQQINVGVFCFGGKGSFSIEKGHVSHPCPFNF